MKPQETYKLADVLMALDDIPSVNHFWRKDCCESITEDGFVPRQLSQYEICALRTEELKLVSDMIDAVELKLPCKHAELLAWAKRCGFADALPDDFLESAKEIAVSELQAEITEAPSKKLPIQEQRNQSFRGYLKKNGKPYLDGLTKRQIHEELKLMGRPWVTGFDTFEAWWQKQDIYKKT